MRYWVNKAGFRVMHIVCIRFVNQIFLSKISKIFFIENIFSYINMDRCALLYKYDYKVVMKDI